MPQTPGRLEFGQPQPDPVWAAADEYAIPHLVREDSEYYHHLNFASDLQQKSGLPDIAVSALQGKFLFLQCKLVRAKNALEFGTLGAYSTIWIASSSPNIKVTTVEYEAHHVKVAKQSLENAGLSDRVEVIHGAGVDIIPGLKEDVANGKRERFDFVFIDADKQNNTNYFNAAVEMAVPGACIIVDNVVRRGRIASDEEAAKDERVKGSREVIEAAGRDPRVDATMIQTVGDKSYDGFLMAVVK